MDGNRSVRWPWNRRNARGKTGLPHRCQRGKRRGLRGDRGNEGFWSRSSRNIRPSFALRIPASKSGKRFRIAFRICGLSRRGQSSRETRGRSACPGSAKKVSCLEVLPSLYPNGKNCDYTYIVVVIRIEVKNFLQPAARKARRIELFVFVGNRAPGIVRIEAFHALKLIESGGPEILLIDNAILADHKAFQPGLSILGRRCNQSETP